MRGRLLVLLVIAVAGAVGAGSVSPAKAEKQAVRAARIPPLPAVPAVRGQRCPLPARYRPSFDAAARATRLPLPMLVAVAEVESRIRQDAVSSAGALGILQVMPTTAAELELDPDRPETNVLAGARYLRMLLDRFQSTDLALAAYNAGPAAVARFGGAPTGATLTYVANVTEIWRSLRGCH